MATKSAKQIGAEKTRPVDRTSLANQIAQVIKSDLYGVWQVSRLLSLLRN